MEEETLDLKDLFNIIWRRKWIIIGITIFFTIIGLAYGFLNNKGDNSDIQKTDSNLYVSRASVLMANFPDAESENIKGQTLLNQQIVRTYGAVASSREVAEDVVDKLKLNTKISDFMEDVKVTVDDKTQLIAVTYGNPDPEYVKKVTDTYLQVFMNKSQKLYPDAKLQIIDKASEPYEISQSDFDKIGSSDQNSQSKQLDSKNSNFKSKRLIAAVFIFLGFILGIGTAFVLEYMNDSIRKKEEAEKILGIDTLGETMFKNKRHGQVSEESYNVLRTALQFKSADNNVFVITSPTAGDGKTKTSAGLAQSFADAGFNTLLIDGNGRHPKMHELLGIEIKKGIADIMEAVIKQDSSLTKENLKKYLMSTNCDNLYLLGWGHNTAVNPSNLFLKADIRNIVEKLKSEYDYIIIDTPDLVQYADAQIFLKNCGVGIMVSSEYKTTRKDAERAKNILSNIGVKPLGLFWINNIK